MTGPAHRARPAHPARRALARAGLLAVTAALLATGLTAGLATGPAPGVPAAADPGPARSARPAGPASAPSTMTVALLQDVDSLNPFVGSYASSVQLFRLAYDYLTDYRTDTDEPGPGLATGWSTSADGRTWTFHLRRGVTWSDGLPLTADDVVFTYRTLQAHPGLANAGAVRTFTDVSAPDAATVVIRTSAPTATMLALDVPIVPEHVWRGLDPEHDPGPVAHLVGSGPFRWTAVRPNQDYQLERNPGHWRGAPAVQRLVLRRYGDSDAAAAALRSGEVDLVSGLTAVQATALRRDRRIGVNDARGTRLTEVGINSGAARRDGTPIGDGHPALRDVRVRQAIDEAVDRRVLVERVLGGHGDPGAGYLPPTMTPWGWTPPDGVRRGGDPARAAALLDAAGYHPGPDGVRADRSGRRLALRLLVPTGRAHYGQSATYLAEWLRAVGIDVVVRRTTDSQVSDAVRHGTFDLYLGGWVLDPDPDYLLSVQTCDARPDAAGEGTTDTFACDARFDRLYEQQVHETDPARRRDLVHRMQSLLYEDAAQLVLYYPAVLEAYRADRFAGLVRRPAGTGSIAGVWSYQVARPAPAPPRDPWGGAAPVVALTAAALLAAALGTAWWRRVTRDRRA